VSIFKRLVIGRPIASSDEDHQRLPKLIGLPVFSSDAISSTAYATQEILFVTAVGASSLALGTDKLIPISIVVAVLIAIVVFSYRQTIYAYPNGGGSYIVSRDSLGRYPSLVSGASLLVDYILTVAVSVSAGVAAITSLEPSLLDQRVLLCVVAVMLLTLANLRGLKESGTLFAVPTYSYILILLGMLIYGLVRSYAGDLGRVEFDPEAAEGIAQAGGTLSLFVLARGFASGAVALTGVEAICDGVPAFRKPSARNAAQTLMLMGTILATLFFGVSWLATRLHPYPSEEETAFSQMGRVVFGDGTVLYYVLQIATCGILLLAANTAYADFPRLASIIAGDSYLPRQLKNRGDRLVYSNGVIILGGSAILLLVGFGGKTNALIPLYAVGVFTSFTLSQSAMFRRHFRLREPNWRLGATINGTGAVCTLAVLLVVAITKFTQGAWLSIVVTGAIIALFLAIRRHYDRLESRLAIDPDEVGSLRTANHTVVVLVSRIHRGVITSLRYAKAMRPNHLVAVVVVHDAHEGDELAADWERYGIDVQLEVIHSPFRELVTPIEEYLDDIDQRWKPDLTTVILPEFVVRWYETPLHNQTALALKLALLNRPDTIVTSVPYHATAET
jgi:amino acid transporter